VAQRFGLARYDLIRSKSAAAVRNTILVRQAAAIPSLMGGQGYSKITIVHSELAEGSGKETKRKKIDQIKAAEKEKT
jgi:hypothetical protein